MKNLEIPNTVTRIHKFAFFNCKNIVNLTIPASVTSFGGSAFAGCIGLESITVESGNTVYHSAGNCLIETASGTLILGCKNSVIPADGSVTSIGVSAFFGCKDLTFIAIPSGVTSIGSNAFYSCKGLKAIVIPLSVTSIGVSTFPGCDSLSVVYYGGGASDWKNISGNGTYDIKSVRCYKYSADKPTVAGDWWHYDNDGNPVVWP